MRTIERTGQFKRDWKRQNKGQHRQALATEFVAIVTALATEFVAIVTALANDAPLDSRHRDHALTGEWRDHRDCHIRPDLVLIYRKPDAGTLQLVRLGSHAELGW